MNIRSLKGSICITYNKQKIAFSCGSIKYLCVSLVKAWRLPRKNPDIVRGLSSGRVSDHSALAVPGGQSVGVV